jgi:hypothetical protein
MLKEEFEKEYNLKIDPDDFRMKRHFEFLRELEATKGYVVWRKNDPWISAYWESNAVIHRNEHDNFANFIETLGVDWYIKGKLARDKSKGNDLSKIYEVIKEYEKKYDIDIVVVLKYTDYVKRDSKGNVTEIYKFTSCWDVTKEGRLDEKTCPIEYEDSIESYEQLNSIKTEKVVKYFREGRYNFKDIDWAKYCEEFNIYPIFNIGVSYGKYTTDDKYTSDEEEEIIEKLLKDIRGYYNKNTMMVESWYVINKSILSSN